MDQLKLIDSRPGRKSAGVVHLAVIFRKVVVYILIPGGAVWMDIFDSESLTPPGSPVLGYSGLRGSAVEHITNSTSSGSLPVYCFNCKGPLRLHDKSFSSDGFFLRSAVIAAIKRLSATKAASTERIVPHLVFFFGHKFEPTDKSQLKTLVRMCRKSIYTLENLANPTFSFGLMGCNGSRSALNEDEIRCPFKLRWDVCSFLNYIVARRVPLTPSDTEELFGGLRKVLERPESWSSSLQHHCGSKDGNECSSSEYHNFHLHLELRWCLLLVFELSEPVLSRILDDLIYLTYVKYKSGEGNLLAKNPFNCYCVKELWAMIRSVVEQLKPNRRDFWDFVLSSITRHNNESDFIFPLWLLSSLVTLGDYGMNGVYTPFRASNQRDKLENCSSAYTLVNQVLKDWVHRGGKIYEVNELVFRLLPYWGYNLEVTLTLWNFWLPRFDKGFEARNVEPYSSSNKWLQLISTIANISQNSEILEYEKSADCLFSSDPFLGFLRLVCAHVKLCSLKDWRKLKSNICNRLPQKTVCAFSENGLTRISTMFLSLALITNDSESMCERLNETLSYGKDSLVISKLRAKCVMILLYLQKGMNVCSISTNVMRTVNEIMGMSVSGRTSTHKDLIMTYLDFLENIQKFNGDLNLGQSSLISLNLTMWLSTCGPNYINRTLRVLHGILDTWILDSGGVPSFEKDAVANIILEKTEQFLKQTVISSQNRNPEFDVQSLADLAVDLTILQSSKKNSVAVGSIYEIFALNPNTSPFVSEIYVEKVMDSSLVLDVYSVINENQLIQSWIRLTALGFVVPLRLSARILSIPYDTLLGSSRDQEAILKRFCSTANESESCWTRSLLLTSISPVLDALKIAKNKSFSSDSAIIDALIKSVMILFQNLPFCNIYIRNNQTSFVHQVLEVCCPNFVGKPPWEKLPDTFIAALNKYLPDVFVAIISYESWFQDAYLKRKIHDLVRFALLGFVRSEELEEGNPGMRIMRHCENLNHSSKDVVMNEIATSVNSLSKEDQIAKRFILMFGGFLKKGLILAAVYLIGSVLDIFIEKLELSNRCRRLISDTWTCVLGRELYSYLKQGLVIALEASMKKHFAFRSDRFFELFSALASNTQHRIAIRKLLHDKMVPMLSDQIILSETKQGSGANYKLRGLLKKLEKDLEL